MTEHAAGSRHAVYPDDIDEADKTYLDSFASVPPGSFIQGFVSVVSFVGPDGSAAWFSHARCDLPAAHVIGLLECAQAEMMANTVGLIPGRLPPDGEGDGL